MKVVEIFKSIDGEGIRAGFPVTFIRLHGCNLRCSFCDSKYSYDEEPYETTVGEIMKKVRELDCKRITLTGGEPLIHKDIMDLILALLRENNEVNIETNGSVDIMYYVNRFPNLILTMDYKCAGSGMEEHMYLRNLQYLRPKDVLKFVVSDKKDLERILKVAPATKAQIFISPVFGKIEPKEIVEFMLENNLNDYRVQLQLHKIIWDPNKRGV